MYDVMAYEWKASYGPGYVDFLRFWLATIPHSWSMLRFESALLVFSR